MEQMETGDKRHFRPKTPARGGQERLKTKK